MNRLGIPVLPSLVNALILVSIFSTTNSFVFSASRAMLGLSQKGQAPKVLGRLNKQGVPWVAVLATLAVGGLSYLSISTSAAKVLDWWISLVGSAQLINWTCIAITWFRFRAALKAQGLGLDWLPVKGHAQTFSGWWVLIWSPVVFIFNGYAVFMPGAWDTPGFIFAYGAGFIFAALWLGSMAWRAFRGHQVKVCEPAKSIDLQTDLDYYEALTAASEAQRASHKRGLGTRISDFFF
jgi:amino acid transporter